MAQALRFAALVRVSTEQQEKTGESLRTQRTENEEAVKQLDGQIVEWYGGQEHATPGFEKKEIDRLLNDAKRGKFNAVIVTNADRWSRDNGKSREGLEIFKAHRVKVFVGTSEYNLFNPEHCLFLGMSAVMGQFFAQNQKRKSLLNRIHRARRGMPTGGKLPFGRTFDRRTETWGVDPAKKKMIEDVAKRYLAGERIADLADEYRQNHANLHKVITKRCGTRWTMKFHSDELNIHEDVEIEVPALLSEATIKALQKKTQANKTYEHGQTKHSYLLTGFVFCAHCGYSMSGQTNSKTCRYYRHCHIKRKRVCECPKTWVRASDLEEVVIRQLFECFGNPHGLKEAIEAATPNKDHLKELRERLKRLEGNLAQIGSARVSILKFISKGTVSETDAEKQLDELKEKEEHHLSELHRLQDSLENAPSSESIRDFATAIAKQVKTSGKRSSERRYNSAVRTAELKSIDRDYSSMTWDQKRALVKTVFNGTQLDGKRMGVYIRWTEEKSGPQQWTYAIYGNLIHRNGSLPISREELDEMLGLNLTVQDIDPISSANGREVHSALHCTARVPLELRSFARFP